MVNISNSIIESEYKFICSRHRLQHQINNTIKFKEKQYEREYDIYKIWLSYFHIR